jgi:hypothetical protein
MFKTSPVVRSILSICALLSCATPAFCNPLNALKLNPFKLVCRAEAVAESVSFAPVLAVTAPAATVLIYDYEGHGCHKQTGATLAAVKAAVTVPVKQIVGSATDNDHDGLNPVANLLIGKF